MSSRPKRSAKNPSPALPSSSHEGKDDNQAREQEDSASDVDELNITDIRIGQEENPPSDASPSRVNADSNLELRKEIDELRQQIVALTSKSQRQDGQSQRLNVIGQPANMKFPDKLTVLLGPTSRDTHSQYESWFENLANVVIHFDLVYCLLGETPQASWIKYLEYKDLNLTQSELEALYIKNSHMLWNLMWQSIDKTVRHSITIDMKNDSNNNLTEVLQFEYRRDKKFFHNCSQFLLEIESRYRPTNVWRIKELKESEMSLRYNIKEEPLKFIEQYRKIQEELQATITGWTPQEEFIQAIDILVRIPSEVTQVLNQFLNPDKNLTIKVVETAMKNWWDIHWKDNRPKQTQETQSNKRPREVANTAKENHKQKKSRNEAKDPASTECKFFKAGNCRKGHECPYLHGKVPQGKSTAFPAIEFEYTPEEEEFESEIANASVEPGAQEGGMVANNLHSTASLTSFLVDSGASSHFVCSKELMSEVTSIPPIRVRGLNGVTTINEAGKVKFDTLVPGNNGKVKNTVTLADVRYCKNAQYNLISVAQVAATGCTVIMNDKGCYIIDRGAFRMTQNLIENTILYAQRVDNIYRVRAESVHNLQSTTAKPTFGVNRAKRRLNDDEDEAKKDIDSTHTSSQARLELEKNRKERIRNVNASQTPKKIPKQDNRNKISASQPEANASVARSDETEDETE